MKLLLFECFSGVLEITLGAFLELIILNKLVGYSAKKNKIPFIIFSVVSLAAVVVGMLFIKDRETAQTLPDTVSMIAYILLPYLLLKPKKKATFFLFGLIYASTADFIVFTISSFAKINSLTYENLIYASLYAILLTFVAIYIKAGKREIPNDFFEAIPTIIYVVIIIADWSSYYGVMLSYDETYFKDVYKTLTLVSAVLITVCLSFVIYRYFAVIQSQKEAEHQLELQLKHYESMTDATRDIRSFRHDIKNNLFSLNIMLSQDKLEEAKKYIENLSGRIDETKRFSYFTGNYLADAILADKAATAAESGTKIEFSGSIPEKGIEKSDLCTVLTNALDNAIEACREIPEAVIVIDSKETPMGYRINISNPVKAEPQIKNGKVKTSKSDKKNHGFGLENISRTVEKYNGFVKVTCENKTFNLDIAMTLNI